MSKIRDFLEPADYRNYRNVRAASLMLVVLGSILALAGVAGLAVEPPSGDESMPALAAVLCLLVGLCGAVGGVATLVANPRWSRLSYFMAALYLLAFPLGTILSIVLFRGQTRYLRDVQRFRESTAQSVAA